MKKIIVVGLGPGGMNHLTLETWELIRKSSRLYLRTSVHPAAEELRKQGIQFKSFDSFYENEESFSELYRKIADYLLNEAELESESYLIYAVPGHPLVAEATVELLLEEGTKRGIEIEVKTGVSFLDAVMTLLGLDPAKGFLVLDALAVREEELNPGLHTVFVQVYNRLVASELKLLLLEVYPPEHPAVIIRNAGIAGQEKSLAVKLAELDHGEYFDHLTSIYLEPCYQGNKKTKTGYEVDPLFDVIQTLLASGGCPWDREQNHHTLRPCLIEETYEVIEAIDSGRMDKLEEELGDLLLQVAFHTALAEERADFTFQDVVNGITQKLIRRHPHVFGDVIVQDSQEVLRNWDIIKKREKGNAGEAEESVMARINRSLPALLLAEEVQKKAAKVGFDWDKFEDAWDKVYEEIDELKAAYLDNNSNIEEEMGDLLFAIVNICRFLKISPEIALLGSVRKFLKRFAFIEDKLRQNGLKWEEMDLKSLDIIWEEAKKAGIK